MKSDTIRIHGEVRLHQEAQVLENMDWNYVWSLCDCKESFRSVGHVAVWSLGN